MVEDEERWIREGRGSIARFERILAVREEIRERLAALVGVDATQVALTASTTDGCNIVLAGLDLGPEDEVITTTDEHFGLIGPLHTSRARVVVVDPDPAALVAAVTPRTRLLALSHVLWTTGQVLPVHELREQTGLPILVDGAQSVGTIPVDARRARLLHDLRPEVALWARKGRARSSWPIRTVCASAGRATSRSSDTSPTGCSSRAPEPRASTRI